MSNEKKQFHRPVGSVMSVEEIRQLREAKERLERAAKGIIEPTEPVYVDMPVVSHMVCDDYKDEVPPPRAYPIETPPLGIGENIMGPTKTLLSQIPEEGAVRTVSRILDEAGINPVEELVRMYEEKVEDPDDPNFGKFVMSGGERRALMKEMLKYTHPQLKSVEHTGNGADNKLIVVLQMPDGKEQIQEVEKRGKVIDVT